MALKGQQRIVRQKTENSWTLNILMVEPFQRSFKVGAQRAHNFELFSNSRLNFSGYALDFEV